MQKFLTTVALAIALLLLLAGCSETGPASEPAGALPTPTELAVQPTKETEQKSETVVSEAEPTTAAPAANGRFPYQDPSLSSEERTADLLSRMSLAEKIGQMTLVEKDSIRPSDVTRLGIGSILSGGGGGPSDNTAEGWLEMVTDYQIAALETDLQIPLLYGVDAVHGHSNVTDATIFPHNIGLGATRDAELVEAIGRATALETLSTGIHWNYSPVLAVPRDIRWGRTYEGYSENTELVTELATALLIGMQGVDGESDLSHPETLLGTPKHYVGDGGTEWGSSTTDNYKIDQGVTNLDEATLREIHLPPYPAAIEAGAMSMMASYSSWGGVKMHGQEYLLTDVLRDELNFEGFVVSDWKAIDQVDDDYYTAVVRSINAGIDLNMVPSDYTGFIRTMESAVRNGDITQERIDEAVSRLLFVKFELGLFEEPYGDPALLNTVGSAEHRDLARQAVRDSLVLLKNQDGALPISDETGRIFVSGIGADDIGLQSGGWTIEWQGFNGKKTRGTTILEGIQQHAGPTSEVVYDRFGKFEVETEQADVGIVVVGERPYAEGQGDSNDLSINRVLIERMAEKADKVVVVLVSGRPMIITEELELADAWVAAWLPGTEGDGVAEVLFGQHPFSGQLPYTWPRSMDQLPFDFENMADQGCDAPLFPYGYGLTVDQTEALIMLDCK